MVYPSVQQLAQIDGLVDGQFLPFAALEGENGRLVWTGRFGVTVEVPSKVVAFVDLHVSDAGRWEVEVAVLV